MEKTEENDTLLASGSIMLSFFGAFIMYLFFLIFAFSGSISALVYFIGGIYFSLILYFSYQYTKRQDWRQKIEFDKIFIFFFSLPLPIIGISMFRSWVDSIYDYILLVILIIYLLIELRKLARTIQLLRSEK